MVGPGGTTEKRHNPLTFNLLADFLFFSSGGSSGIIFDFIQINLKNQPGPIRTNAGLCATYRTFGEFNAV